LPVAVPLRQNLRISAYLARQKLARREKCPLIVELEPLFACNLTCAGCGKIQYPAHILKQRMGVAQAVAAVEECGAPMVSIAGGEPLIHPEAHIIAAQLVARRKFVYFCTNALLMRRKMDNFTPSPYFAWAVHLDGLRERHDASVDHAGTFDEAVEAIKEAQRRGFRVTTNTTFFNTDTRQTVREVLDFLNDELRVDQMMISPAYAYWKAPDQEHFLGAEQTRVLFRQAFADGRRRRWRLNHSPLFLDFLEGKTDFGCTAWGIPSYSLFGWQRPCYLMSDGYARTYQELVETTDWSALRTRARPALRQLHGALRLRADCSAGHHELAQTVAARPGGRITAVPEGGRGWRVTADVTAAAAVIAAVSQK
jgi:hopanoid biosynthesis associated radical SAM protein HpnH